MHREVEFQVEISRGQFLKKSASVRDFLLLLDDRHFVERLRSLDASLVEIDDIIVDGDATNYFGVTLAETIATKIKQLRKLKMADCNLSEASLCAIAKTTLKSKIEELDLSSSRNLGSKSVFNQFCILMGSMNHLRELHLQHCGLAAQEFVEVLRASRRCGLLKLDVSGNSVSKDAGAKECFSLACEELSCCNNLTRLDISRCSLSGIAIRMVAKALASRGCGLKFLDISGNPDLASSVPEFFSEIIDCLVRNGRLQKVRALGFELTDEQMLSIRSVINQSQSHLEFICEQDTLLMNTD